VQHYSVDRAVISKYQGELRNSSELFVPDITPVRYGYPYLASVGYNSDVMVYDAETGRCLRKETPQGKIIEVYQERSLTE
jgi:hypothetical protein